MELALLYALQLPLIEFPILHCKVDYEVLSLDNIGRKGDCSILR